MTHVHMTRSDYGRGWNRMHDGHMRNRGGPFQSLLESVPFFIRGFLLPTGSKPTQTLIITDGLETTSLIGGILMLEHLM